MLCIGLFARSCHLLVGTVVPLLWQQGDAAASLCPAFATEAHRCTLQVSGRRLQNFGGAVHEKWGGLIQAPLPGWMQSLLDTVQQRTAVFDPAANHVLLNAYSPGEGIMVS